MICRQMADMAAALHDERERALCLSDAGAHNWCGSILNVEALRLSDSPQVTTQPDKRAADRQQALWRAGVSSTERRNFPLAKI